MRIKPISISLSPNTERDDVFLALRLLFQPWKWKKGRSTEELEEKFKEYFKSKYAFSFNSGRSCLLAILKDLEGEALTQAFTCNAALNPIIWSGMDPVYVDSNNDFNIDAEDARKKIGQKSKALIVQHTFGMPADMDELVKIAEENNLMLIEDCAHSLGAEYKGRKIGTFGKAAFFSFSRDKIISSVYGGVVITNDDKLAAKIKDFQERIGYPSLFWIKQQLFHPILMNWLILPTYRILGKYLLVFFQSVKLMSKAVHWREKIGDIPRYFPRRMPNALAVLALNQFKKLERFNNHRKYPAGVLKIFGQT
jgi:perosamine synthetase